jgi:hypothetical protein
MAEAPRPAEPAPSAAPPDLPQSQPGAAGTPSAPKLSPARARGRRTAFVLYLLVALVVGAAGGIQVFAQAFERREAPEIHVKSCPDGLARLAAAVERARTAASVTDGEDAALDRFRRALQPDWDDRDHIEDLCQSSPSSMAALDAIEQLRYAEEHAVRREAAELAPLRRRVQALSPQWASAPADAPSTPSPPPLTERRDP